MEIILNNEIEKIKGPLEDWIEIHEENKLVIRGDFNARTAKKVERIRAERDYEKMTIKREINQQCREKINQFRRRSRLEFK